eukprot:353354-Chlamydomonas_euryale.AAC.5
MSGQGQPFLQQLPCHVCMPAMCSSLLCAHTCHASVPAMRPYLPCVRPCGASIPAMRQCLRCVRAYKVVQGASTRVSGAVRDANGEELPHKWLVQ